ncbi:hypothetical protein SAMN05443144_12816 [Fodinibius roseus]|uniref:Uncharacterized protein n=1 Tax=Fodinibius roseus TaxID=1194090 RepID=A0A1M5JQJ4_9BACT|nr:hypothetical protein SAMN05443144_12816 [Fodinibius roseus]
MRLFISITYKNADIETKKGCIKIYYPVVSTSHTLSKG